MSEIDSVIENIRAGIDAMPKAAEAADRADVPAEERVALEQARETLRSLSDRMNDLAMTQGLTRRIGTMHIELKHTGEEHHGE